MTDPLSMPMSRIRDNVHLLRETADLMRAQHPPSHERHEMWEAIAEFLEAQALRALEGWSVGHAVKIANAYPRE